MVATDAVLNHEDLQRLAMMSQDGYARAIRPVHTPFDGDTLFAISTEKAQEPVTLLRLGTIAAYVVARAIMRGVFHASDIAGHQSYANRWGAHREQRGTYAAGPQFLRTAFQNLFYCTDRRRTTKLEFNVVVSSRTIPTARGFLYAKSRSPPSASRRSVG